MKRRPNLAAISILMALLIITATLLIGCISIPIPNKISATDFLF